MSRLKNFLIEDLQRLQKAYQKIDYVVDARIYKDVQEETGIQKDLEVLRDFISYWSTHAKNIGE
tara:strand:+ start:3499 stop:3690 length:192 start_codon:yes stop_codon:yes gene_type:complete